MICRAGAGEVSGLGAPERLFVGGTAFIRRRNQRGRANLNCYVSPDAVACALGGCWSVWAIAPMWAVAGDTPMDQELWLFGEGSKIARVVDVHGGPSQFIRFWSGYGCTFEEQWAESMVIVPGLGTGVPRAGRRSMALLNRPAMH